MAWIDSATGLRRTLSVQATRELGEGSYPIWCSAYRFRGEEHELPGFWGRPYVNETELVMDVLRHGGNASVKAPRVLVTAVNEQLRGALAINEAFQ